MIRLSIFAALLISATTIAARAADAPAEIKLGTLYASSGRYASISMPVHYGLKLWIDQKNAEGLKRFCLRKLAALGHKVTLEAAA